MPPGTSMLDYTGLREDRGFDAWHKRPVHPLQVKGANAGVVVHYPLLGAASVPRAIHEGTQQIVQMCIHGLVPRCTARVGTWMGRVTHTVRVDAMSLKRRP